MSEYQFLTSDILVPDKWPVTAERFVIIKLVKKVIREHQFDQRVVITIDNVSALIIEGWPRYTLERIEHERDQECTCYIDLLLPVQILLLKLHPDGSYLFEENLVPFLSKDLTFDHPISRLFGSSSTGHRVAVAAPNLKNILRQMNVTGEDLYNYTLVTTYRNSKGLVPQQFVQETSAVGPNISVKKISEDLWNIVCTDHLIKPQQSWSNRTIVEPLMSSPLFRRRL